MKDCSLLKLWHSQALVHLHNIKLYSALHHSYLVLIVHSHPLRGGKLLYRIIWLCQKLPSSQESCVHSKLHTNRCRTVWTMVMRQFFIWKCICTTVCFFSPDILTGFYMLWCQDKIWNQTIGQNRNIHIHTSIYYICVWEDEIKCMFAREECKAFCSLDLKQMSDFIWAINDFVGVTIAH